MAIGAGIFLGLIVAFGVWQANKALTPKKSEQVAAVPSPTPAFGVTIANPADYAVLGESQAAISGVTRPGYWTVVSADETDEVIQANPEGGIVTELGLSGGVNEIKVFAFDEKGSGIEKNLLVAYSSEFEEEAPANKRKIFYMGTVTDKTEAAVQMTKFATSEIQQISIDTEVTFAKVGSATKAIKFEDVAIGDFIVAMGYQNGNGVLTAKRILVTTPFTYSGRKALIGEVKSLGKKDFVLVAAGEEWTVTFKKKPSGLVEGAKVIVVGTATDKMLEARTIYLTDPAE